MFSIPTVTRKNLIRMHSMAFGIPRINGDAYTCIPTPGQLFTNKWGDAPDWVLMPEGYSAQRGPSRPGLQIVSTTRTHQNTS